MLDVCLILKTSLVAFSLDPSKVFVVVVPLVNYKLVSAYVYLVAWVKFIDKLTDVTGTHFLKS